MDKLLEILEHGYGEMLIKIHQGEICDVEITFKDRPKFDTNN